MLQCRSLCLILLLAAVTTGCDPQARGFSLPLGDAAAGKATFVSLGCNHCHSVADVALDASAGTELRVPLGGKVGKAKAYGELVTSVINPSHRIARVRGAGALTDEHGTSLMPTYNSLMTVDQLVDVVTFLEDEYELEVPRTHYPMYY